MASAKAFVHGAEYAPVEAIRHASADYAWVILEDVPAGPSPLNKTR
jgi:hypothetical protein